MSRHPRPQPSARRRVALVATAAALAGLAGPLAAPTPAGAAPPGTANWALAAGGVSSDAGEDVAVDAAGNSYVAGTFVLNMSLDGTPLASNGDADAFVAKIDAGGNLAWLRKVGGADNDGAVGVEVDAAGNVYVGGWFETSMTFAGQTVTANGQRDSFVTKFTAAGEPQWVRTVSAPTDRPFALATTTDGDVALAGTFTGTATSGAASVSAATGDVYLARWSSNGALDWLRSGGSPANEDLVSLAPLGTGVVLSALGGGQAASYGGVAVPVPPGTAQSAALVSYAANGTVSWARAMTTAGTVLPQAVVAHPQHGIVVGGTFDGTLSSGARSATSNGTSDAFLAAFSPTGSPTRVDAVSGTGSDMATNLAWDESGLLVTSVRITGTLALGGVAHAPQGPSDQVVVAFTPSREVVWASRVSGPAQDSVGGLAVAGDGDLLVVGTSTDEVSFAGVSTPLSGADAWVSRVEDPTRLDGTLRYRPLGAPVRVLDSRKGTGGYSTPWAPGATRSVKVANTLGIPAGAAVALNLTATEPTATTHLTVWPTGSPRPTASNLNVAAGQTAANLVVAKVSAQGYVDIVNSAGSTHVVADVVGVYQADGTQSEFAGLTPFRILDSRTGTGGHATPWPAATSRDVVVAGVPGSGVPATATAVVLDVTAVAPTDATHLTVWPAGAPQPTASSLNLGAGETRANLVVAKVGVDREVTIRNNSGSTDVVADVVGYFTTSGVELFAPMSPARVLDTRDGTGGPATKVAAGTPRAVKVTGVGGVPSDATSVVLNVTVVDPTAASHLTVWPHGAAMPTASNLNFAAGATVPNLVMAKVGSQGQVSIANNTGSTHVVVDVVGWYAP